MPSTTGDENSPQPPRRIHPSAPLPPELDPRGRRVARHDAKRRAAMADPRSAPTARSTPPGQPPRTTRAATHRGTGGGRNGGSSGTSVARGAKWGGRVIAGGLSLLILIGSGWAWATYRNFNNNIKRLGGVITASSGGGIDGTDQNILIVGNDDRDTATNAELKDLGTTRDGGSYNTDTMMLLHVPANGAKATMISFPRDSWVNIAGLGYNKLNAAYVLGMNAAKGDKAAGAKTLIDTIQAMTGLAIDHFVQVDLIGFYRISNAIGGVDVCLNAAMGPATKYGQEGNGYDSGFEPSGQFVYSYSSINLHAGVNNIKGTQALAFVRQRHGLPQGDLDRIKRQQYFLSAVFRKMSSTAVLTSPTALTSLLGAVSSSLQVDSGLKLLDLASQMRNLQAGNLQFATIPTLGFGTEKLGGSDVSVVEVDANGMKDFVDNLISNDAQTALNAAKAAKPSDVGLELFNDTSKNGVENTVSQTLQAAGFHVTLPGPTRDVLAKTTIRYPKGAESAAKALAAMIPGVTMVRTSTVNTVTLLLGNDNLPVIDNSSSSATASPSSSSAKVSSAKATSSAPATASAASSTPATVSNGAVTAADTSCIN